MRSAIPIPLLVALFCFGIGCQGPEPPQEHSMADRRPIADVIRDHAPALMEHAGVVGVYEGRTGEGQACLKVMVVERTERLREIVPRTIDGYPVELHATGPIGPAGDS